MMLTLAAAAVPQAAQAKAAIVENAGFAFGMLDEFGIACAILAALFLIDKASWSFMTGSGHKR